MKTISVSFLLQGVSYNHIELNFYLNGQKLDCPFTNVRGQVYPAVYGKGIGIDYFTLIIVYLHSHFLQWKTEPYWTLFLKIL